MSSMVFTDETCPTSTGYLGDIKPAKNPYIFLAVKLNSPAQTYIIYRSNPDFTSINTWVTDDKMPNNEHAFGKSTRHNCFFKN